MEKITNQAGIVTELNDFYPFGKVRYTEGGAGGDKAFLGKYHDTESGLEYLEARYYGSKLGQFTSQDPAFLDVGEDNFKNKYNRDLRTHLSSPQGLNSYSYAANNPLTYSDPEGEILPALAAAYIIAEVALSAYDAYDTVKVLSNPSSTINQKNIAIGLFAAGLYSPGAGYSKADDVARGIKNIQNIARQANWGNSASLLDHTMRHASDFNLKNSDYIGYAKASNNFISNADNAIKQGDNNFESFIGKGGKTYFFNKKIGMYGIRNVDGTIGTVYKPKGGNLKKATNYWNNKKKLMSN